MGVQNGILELRVD